MLRAPSEAASSLTPRDLRPCAHFSLFFVSCFSFGQEFALVSSLRQQKLLPLQGSKSWFSFTHCFLHSFPPTSPERGGLQRRKPERMHREASFHPGPCPCVAAGQYMGNGDWPKDLVLLLLRDKREIYHLLCSWDHRRSPRTLFSCHSEGLHVAPIKDEA